MCVGGGEEEPSPSHGQCSSLRVGMGELTDPRTQQAAETEEAHLEEGLQ